MEKKEFLDRLRANTREQYDMPDMNINGITYPDTVKQFIEMTQSVGGSVVEAKPTDDLNTLINKAYPDARSLQAIFRASMPNEIPTQSPKQANSTAPM